MGINPVMRRHLESEIKTLQNAPRDPDKLKRLLEVKQRQKEEAMDIEDTQRLVTEIEILKLVLYLVCRKQAIATKDINKKSFFFLFSFRGCCYRADFRKMRIVLHLIVEDLL
jgi:hypothetical protein